MVKRKIGRRVKQQHHFLHVQILLKKRFRIVSFSEPLNPILADSPEINQPVSRVLKVSVS